MPSKPDTFLASFCPAGNRSWLIISLFIVFLLISQLAPLMSPSYIWDDLVWYWTFSKDGTVKLFELLNEVGHPGFWPFLDAAYRYFGAHATFPTSLISIASHVLNAIILMRLLSYAGGSRAQVVVVFFLYLFSPYYFNRGTVSHYFYDVFMLFFLGSVYLGVPNKEKTPTRTALALCAQIFSFGLPTLMMLEPLRLFVYWKQCKGNRKKLIHSIALFWAVTVVCAVCTFVLFKPSGYYAGYNEIQISAGSLWAGLYGFFAYVPSMFFYHTKNIGTVFTTPRDWFIIVCFLVVVIYVVWHFLKNINDTTAWTHSLILLFLGILLLVSGSLPYILAGRKVIPWDFNSRLFYVSGIGLIVMFYAIQALIPLARLRTLFVALLVCFFMLSNLGQAKLYLYDHSVRQEILQGLEQWADAQSEDDKRKDIFMVLTSNPELRETFFQNRFVTAVEFSVPLNINNPLRNGKQFIYYYVGQVFHAPDIFLPTLTPYCSLAAHDRHPCPTRYSVATYEVAESSRINDINFLDLFNHVFANVPLTRIGTFKISVQPKIYNREEMTSRWYLRSAELGVPGSQNIVGEMYLFGTYNLPHNEKIAAEWFSKAVAGGSRDARVNLGILHLEGRGVKKDINRGVELLHWGANDGYPRAQYRLGALHEQGIGVTQDIALALEWYLKAATAGYPPAQLQLGLMYANGHGVSRKIDDAVLWLTKAAIQNDMAAQYHLAMLCSNHFEIRCKKGNVSEYLSKSALQGYVPAQWQLAQIYEYGTGVPRDLYLAYFWYRVVGLGQEDTEQGRSADMRSKGVGLNIPDNERSYIEQRARAWKPVSRQGAGM